MSGTALAVDGHRAEHLGSFTWRGAAPWHGGFSALEMSGNGGRAMILGDRAWLVSATIHRRDGRISGVRADRATRLRSSRNKPLGGRAGDSEGLALSPRGTLYVSFEGVHRVARYDSPDGRARVLPRPDAFRKLAVNGSFEALAMDDHGHLFTMPESNRTKAGEIPVYRWDGQNWSTPFQLEQRGDFLPVGADFGPDGRLYVLERAIGLLGFRSRLRRWTATPGGVTDEETLLQTGSGTHGNLEGLSIWRDGNGRLIATMISDDNFMDILRTELVEYGLPD